MDSYPAVIAIVISIILSAFFSGIEIAFISANKLKVELDKKQGIFSAKVYSKFIKSPSRFITTMLLGNNISLVIFGIAAAALLEPLFQIYFSNKALILLCQTIVSTLIILFTAEFLPKAMFSINPNRTLNLFSIPVFLTYYLLFPLVSFVNWISNGILKKVLKVNPEEKQVVFSVVDLDNYVNEIVASFEDEDEIENEIQIVRNALEFREVKARECMIPRTEIVSLDVETEISILTDQFIKTGLSKILIYRDSIDNIIGYVHSSELFKKPEAIKNILLPISIVPETMPAKSVLELLTGQKRSIAVVVDEFGGTSGMLTIEDVVEEIFGDIEDEHDVETLTEYQISEIEYRFSARLEVDYINEEYKLQLPDSEDYETLAGLIISISESIPEQGEVISSENFDFLIEKVDQKRIEMVKVTIKSAN